MQRVRISSQQSPVVKLGHTQMTLTPKFRLGAGNLQVSPDSDVSELQTPLIPGLPDDVAVSCLLRLPVYFHPVCRSVCRRWRLLLATKDRFFTLRRALRFRDPWLFVFAFHRVTGKAHWQVLDLIRLSWHTVPPMPMPCRGRVCPRGFACADLANQSSFLVCGGVVSNVDCPLDLVLKFDMQTNRWTVMTRMLTPRSFFAIASIGGLVYAAGGSGNADLFELSSAEVLDPPTSRWKPIPSMGTNMAPYDAAVLDGKLFVTEGWVWPFLFSPRGQVYDPASNAWESMPTGLREGWTGSSAVVDGHLFVVSEHERMRVKVYDKESDSWETVAGSPVPEWIKNPFSVSSSGSDGRLYVVGRDLDVAVGHVVRRTEGDVGEMADVEKERRGWRFSIKWEHIGGPFGFSDLTPSTSQILFG